MNSAEASFVIETEMLPARIYAAVAVELHFSDDENVTGTNVVFCSWAIVWQAASRTFLSR